MSTMTVGDLLDRCEAFERQLEAYYADIRERSTDNGIRLLTYYLVRHRRHQQMALEGMDTRQLAAVRGANVTIDESSIPGTDPRTPQTELETMTGKTLIEAALRYDNTLLSVYRSILAQPLHDDAQTIIEALVRMEERDIVLLKKMLAMQYF